MSLDSTADDFVKKTEKRLGELEKSVQELEWQLKAMKAHPQTQPTIVGRYASQDEADQIKKRLEELERRVSDAEGPPTES
jgi:tetrahydromethanopterin S-methyltransferase subunit G